MFVTWTGPRLYKTAAKLHYGLKNELQKLVYDFENEIKKKMTDSWIKEKKAGNTTAYVPPRILASKGQKQIESVTLVERGINVIIVAVINAVGNQIPHMLIFPRMHFKERMLKGAPPGAIAISSMHEAFYSPCEADG
ncbi:hypothetical protein ILUMI_23820 [Ignelater luminosus]|uniref:Uncharacterized protein n=1 Tax=Ignelater luminosus TaxID=2038154 RepID=A0A8K0C842_IGNLU|nr:hypothetical protein ILUMI_23820 [Ignelater luminosus]